MDSPALASFEAKDSLQRFITNHPPSRPVWWKGTQLKRLPRDKARKKNCSPEVIIYPC